MALPDFFKRKPHDDAGSGARTVGSADAVEKVRTRTRQRLIGAVLLLTLGVIGFPLLFESQPRPIPVDIPIEIPRADGSPALVLPALSPAAPESTVASGVVTRDAPAEPPSPPAETAVASAPPAAPVASAASAPASTQVALPAAPASSTKSAPAAAKPAASSALPPKPSSSEASAARYVVQVGAFAEVAAAREVRKKMDKLGLKTYTQMAETSTGKRIRVRLGPFSTRAEADKVQARAKEAGVAAVVLTL